MIHKLLCQVNLNSRWLGQWKSAVVAELSQGNSLPLVMVNLENVTPTTDSTGLRTEGASGQ